MELNIETESAEKSFFHGLKILMTDQLTKASNATQNPSQRAMDSAISLLGISTKNVLGNGNNTTFIMQQINSGAFFNCLSSISVVSQHTSALENVQTYIWNNSF